jgi:hypothetical protein
MNKDEEISRDLVALSEKKAEVLLASGKEKTYVREKVFKHRKEWWDKWLEMLHSGEKDLEKTALVEYNKLQARILPTQLETDGNSNISINIIGMGIEEPIRKVYETEQEPVQDGEVEEVKK